MLNACSTNQRALRRSRRNRRNRQQPETPPNRRQRVQFSPKLKYENSLRTEDGVFFLSKRKRAPPTAEELEARKRKKFAIEVGKISLIALRHKVISLWETGMCTSDLQFGPGQSKKIIQWLQNTHDAYRKFEAAKSFFYRALKRHKNRLQTPHLEPHRRRKQKKNEKGESGHRTIM